MTKRPAHRPSTYIAPKVPLQEPEYRESQATKLLELLTCGVLNSGCMAELGICEDTFYRWIKEHPDFSMAYKLGRPRCEWFHAKRLEQMTEERDDKGCKACIMILNNNFGWDKGKAQQGTQNIINIQGNMNVLNQKSAHELIEFVENDLEYLRLNNIIDIEPSPNGSE